MPADLIISEYIEGSGQNKAIEIYNPTGAPISLSGYILQFYFNGSTSVGLTITLNAGVMLAPGAVYVVSQATADALILAQADQTSAATNWFNGNDAVVLRKGGAAGTVVDSLGQIGTPFPATEWGTGLTSTADNTLVRKSGIVDGDTNPFDTFTPSVQWDGFATNTFSNLGTHSSVPTYTINPLSADKSEGDVGTTSFTFTVTRPSGTTAESIAYSVTGTGGGPADADPADFAGGAFPTDTIHFAIGETSRTLTIQVAAETIAEIDESFRVTLNVENSPFAIGTIRNDDVVEAQISDIQGAGHRSPLEGLAVATTGIVTAVTSNGFWIQDATPDSDARTSEGLFVFTSSAPPAGITVGAEVRVSGRVAEFFPNSDIATELSTTEIIVSSASAIQLTGNSGTIAATAIGAGGLLPPTENFGDDDNATFDPATEGLDFWESVEGMIVTLNDATATGPTDIDAFDDGQTFVTLERAGAGLRTPTGGLIIQEGDFNPERIAVQEDDRILDNPYVANVGDSLGDVTGVVSYDRNGFFEVIATETFAVTPGGIEREAGTELAAAPDQLTIASYNAENLSLRDGDAKFLEIARQIVEGLNAPDIIALQEIQDDNGSTSPAGGVVTSDATLAKLIATIEAVGGPTYQFAYVAPVFNQDGGQSGGNIRQVFLYSEERVQLAEGDIGGSTEAITVSDVGGDGVPDLSLAVGRIEPTDTAFANSRKPLIAEFIFNGESVFVINNHWNSKIGDDPLFGTNQPPFEETEAKRIEQAEIVADFVAQILAIDPDANIAVVGDLNDFAFSDSIERLEAAGLSNLAELLPANERYDYVFQGNSQQLDHIFVSGNLGEEAAFDILHINAEFSEQTSDHDPLVARLNIASAQTIDGGNGDDLIVGGAGNDSLTGGNGADRVEGGNGKDTISGGRGDDVLIGGIAADRLDGGQGADMLDGGAGNDVLIGGSGGDWLAGGSGADDFHFASNGGWDVVLDFETGVDALILDGIGVRNATVGDVNGDGIDDLAIGFTGTGGGVTLLGIDSLEDAGFGDADALLWDGGYFLAKAHFGALDHGFLGKSTASIEVEAANGMADWLLC